MSKEKTYLYGPVPSRRLGLSLGVDIVPFKLCTLDCVYCQLGGTTEKSVQRREFAPVKEVLDELKKRLRGGLETDFITISGSGEPTLHSCLGEIVQGIKRLTDIPVAILTNGTLLTNESVSKDCLKADVVLPSLDAADQETFQKINKPHSDISIENVISGLCKFRDEFQGQIWLEVFIVEGLNTEPKQISKIKDAIKRIRPDKIQLNTAVRPTAVSGVKKVDYEKLEAISEEFGGNCEIIIDLPPIHRTRGGKSSAEDVLSMLKRRPCSLEDVCTGLSMHRNEVLKYINDLHKRGLISSIEKDKMVFYKAT